jgi:hypothetical protein
MVTYDGQRYQRNLALCWTAMRQRRSEGEFSGVPELATMVAVSRPTLYRFFSGHWHGPMDAVLRILARLRLDFDAVHAPEAVVELAGELGMDRPPGMDDAFELVAAEVAVRGWPTDGVGSKALIEIAAVMRGCPGTKPVHAALLLLKQLRDPRGVPD